MKTSDAMIALIAFAAVVGVGVWLMRRANAAPDVGQGAATNVDALAAFLLAEQGAEPVWSGALAPAYSYDPSWTPT